MATITLNANTYTQVANAAEIVILQNLSSSHIYVTQSADKPLDSAKGLLIGVDSDGKGAGLNLTNVVLTQPLWAKMYDTTHGDAAEFHTEIFV